MPLLAIDALTVRFPGVDVPTVDGLSLALQHGRIGCLLGPSGCGKTTVLRAIAGFQPIAGGRIAIAGHAVATPDASLPPERRGVGIVFQDYALFPHLTVAANVGFGLRRLPASEREPRVRELLELVGLREAGRRYPHELSGGQQQRVALARALAPRPRLLLLDEPFSNLDPDLRERLAVEVREILQRDGTTALLVTHDQNEAFAMADVIGVMAGGRLAQWDAPWNLYHRPATRAVADFIGQGVFMRGRVHRHGDGKPCVDIGLNCLVPIEDRDAAGIDAAADAAGEVLVLLRPDDVVHDDDSPLQAEVVRKAFRGAEFLYTLRLADGQMVLAMVPSHHNHATGERIGIRFLADHVVTFPV